MTIPKKIEDGGPAFPHMAVDGHPDYRLGLSLRDWFAGKALAGMLASETDGSTYREDHAAERAYRLADAMLAARKAGEA
jgi:hypothetical protein